MWHLIGRSVGTYLLIAYWELLISLSLMHAWLLYSFGTLTCWLWWSIILIKDSDVVIFLYFIAISFWDIDMLIVLIDYLTYLRIVTLISPWLFWSPRTYRFTVVYHLTWCVDSLVCILSCSSLSVMSVSLFILIVIACMWTWVIYSYFARLYVAWLPSSVWLHVVCLCGPHIYPLTSNPLVSIISFISTLIFASVRPYVCLLLWPS